MTNNLTDYAFIDSEGLVLNICVFEGFNEELLEHIKNQMGAMNYISCKDNGVAAIGGRWTGEYFIYEDGTRVPPVKYPEDNNYLYSYDWELMEWVPIAENRMKNF